MQEGAANQAQAAGEATGASVTGGLPAPAPAAAARLTAAGAAGEVPAQHAAPPAVAPFPLTGVWLLDVYLYSSIAWLAATCVCTPLLLALAPPA